MHFPTITYFIWHWNLDTILESQSPVRFDGPPAANDLVELKGRTKRLARSLACFWGLHILSHSVLSTRRPKCFRNVLLILMTIGSIIKEIRHFCLLCPFFSSIPFLLFLLKKKRSSKLIYFDNIKAPQVNSTLNNKRCDIFALKKKHFVKLLYPLVCPLLRIMVLTRILQ